MILKFAGFAAMDIRDKNSFYTLMQYHVWEKSFLMYNLRWTVLYRFMNIHVSFLEEFIINLYENANNLVEIGS
jgi:hypothetical protein